MTTCATFLQLLNKPLGTVYLYNKLCFPKRVAFVTKAAKDWQPSAFLYGYSMTHGELSEFRFDVVVKNKTPVFEQHVTQRGLSDFLRLVEMAKLAQSMIAAEHFYPSEQGFYCGGCPHQEACRTWHVERSRTVVPVAA